MISSGWNNFLILEFCTRTFANAYINGFTESFPTPVRLDLRQWGVFDMLLSNIMKPHLKIMNRRAALAYCLCLHAGILTWRLNSQLRHAGLDPASSAFLDSRLRGNDNLRVFNHRSNNIQIRNSNKRNIAITILMFRFINNV